MKLFGVFLMLVGATIAQALAEGESVMTYVMPNGLEIHESRLKNGLRVVVIPNHFAPVLTYRTVYNVGSADEMTGKRGIAHLFEHMMFRETKHLKNGEFDLRVTRMGGTQLNAYTSTDRTVYLQSLPNQFLDDMATLESDRMVNLIINQEKLDVERGAVLSEYYMHLNNAGSFFFKTLNEHLYHQHPYKYEVIGTEAEIKSFTVKECLDFYKRYYAPNNATVVVVGDVMPEQVVQTVQKHYGNIPSSDIQRPDMLVELPQAQQIVQSVQHPYASQVEMGMGFKILNFEEEELAYFLVIQELLGADEFGVAYPLIVKKGLGTSVNSYFDLNPKGEPKAFYFMVTLAPGVQTQKMRLVTLDVFDHLKSRPLSMQKIQMAVNQIKLHYFATANEEMADMVIDGLNYSDDPTFTFRYFYDTFLKIKLNPKKLLDVARKYFKPEHMTFLFLSPGSDDKKSKK